MNELGYIIAIIGFCAIAVMWMVAWKRDSESRFNILTKVARDIYMLSNSHMAEQLLVNKRVTRRLADLTKDAEDEAQAMASQARYEEHQSRQGMVDIDRIIPLGIDDENKG